MRSQQSVASVKRTDVKFIKKKLNEQDWKPKCDLNQIVLLHFMKIFSRHVNKERGGNWKSKYTHNHVDFNILE